MKKTNVDERIELMSREVIEAIEDKKGTDVLMMRVEGRCAITDRFVLATGRNSRQLMAMAQSVSMVAHRHGFAAHIEGREAAEWLLIDLGDIVVHLFLPEVRESFQLERLWMLPEVGAGHEPSEQTDAE
ncbi:MAG: ribosome silencing factor [Mariprofundaceae bacterium]|nr:ribosome silencing factor [Mariprofundaceae bacterium]